MTEQKNDTQTQNIEKRIFFRRNANNDLIGKIFEALQSDDVEKLGEYKDYIRNIAFDILTLGYYEQSYEVFPYIITFRSLTQKEIVDYDKRKNDLLLSRQDILADILALAYYIRDIKIDIDKYELFKEKLSRKGTANLPVPPLGVDLSVNNNESLELKTNFLLSLPQPIYDAIADKSFEFAYCVNGAIRLANKFLDFFLTTEKA